VENIPPKNIMKYKIEKEELSNSPKTELTRGKNLEGGG